MSEEVLYHFFPRQNAGPAKTSSVLKSIFDNGLFLTKEIVSVPWKDYYGKKGNRKLSIEQYRFCLTAISNKEELVEHSKRFGYIGLEFNSDFITQLGGFPVFYVPSPKYESVDKEDYKGISLLYRIAEVQELLEYSIRNNVMKSKDIDIENALGAIKLLGNICYPTRREIKNQTRANYYNQREWRIIYGLTSDKASVKSEGNNYAIKFFDNKPIFNYINKIVLRAPDIHEVNGDSFLKEKDIQRIVNNYNSNIKVENICLKKRNLVEKLLRRFHSG